MRKPLLLAFGLLLSLGATQAAQAQVNFIRMGINAATLAKRAANKDKNAAETPASSYQGQSFPMVRTPADQLPKKGAEQITAMETELDRCHTALLASPTGTICTPEQRTALQTAIRNLASAQSSKNLPAYQQEASFYLAEDARRQQAAAAPAPAK